jgi:flagellar L-ring protein precursor FlgH
MPVETVLRRASLAAALACFTPIAALAQAPANYARVQGPGNYEDAYARYLAAARRTAEPVRPLWMVDLTSDTSARRVNDLVTIRVLEVLSASGSADSNLGKSGNASVSLPGGKIADWIGKALPASTETGFTGTGGTSRTTAFSAMLTARVTEVLPNGDLVVEGVREIDINGDRAVVVLTGVVRPVDIQPGNVVLSGQVGQLRIRSFSAGLIKDSLTPGWLVRALNKVF